MDISITNIHNKLVSGEKLSINDLRSLEPLHDAIYDNDGRVVGVSGSTTGKEHDPLTGDFSLEYVNRSFIDGRPGQEHGRSSKRLPRLVRYVGMVQDQLDPEFYEAYDSQGRSKHFGNHYDLTSDDGNSTNCTDDYCVMDSSSKSKDCSNAQHMGRYSDCLAERIPLVVVPIPFASDWLFRGIQARSSSSSSDPGDMDSSSDLSTAPKSAVVSPVSTIRGERKRGRNDVNDDGDDDMNGDHNLSSFVSEDSKTNQQTRQKTTACEGGRTTESRGGENGGENCLNSISLNETDWWPAGTCGTSMDECPILAKLCYDELISGEQDNSRGKLEEEIEEGKIEGETEDSSMQRGTRTIRSQRQRPLMLNDVVSLVGVLSMDPWEADFSGQHSSSITSINDINYYGLDSTMATMDTIPPPSRLPRLHVLSYRRLDLDELARRSIDVEKKNYCKSTSSDDELLPEIEGIRGASRSPNSDSDSDDDSDVEWSGFPSEEKSIPLGIASLLQDGPSGSLTSIETMPWIKAIWLCLLSQADRRGSNMQIGSRSDCVAPKMVRAGPAERALGCVSLQLSTPDVASAKLLYRKLAEIVLPGVCPVVASVDLAEMVATGTNDISFVPRKDNSGRLKPCPLQLPKGSVLLVHYPSSCIDRSNRGSQNSQSKRNLESEDNKKLESIQTVLRELVQHHRIPYRFEGGVTIPFEADYRVIIVTTQTQDLPCTLSALTKTCSATPMPVAVSSTTRMYPTKPELREFLVKGRSLTKNNDSLKFSSILLERAQRDFLERRRRNHESSTSSALPGEDDFHRWLTMTRLQSKNRFSRNERSNSNSHNVSFDEMGRAADLPISTQYLEPLVEDWEAALKLDDDLRCMV